MKKLIFLCFVVLFGCSGGEKQQATPVLNQSQTPGSEIAVSEPPVNNKDSVHEKKDWIADIQKLGQLPNDQEYEDLSTLIKESDLSDQDTSDLKNIVHSFYLIENQQREKTLISCAINHQNKDFREACVSKLISVNQSVPLAQELIKQSQISSLYRERYVDGLNVRAALDQEIEKFLYYVDLFIKSDSSAAATLLCLKVLDWQHSVFYEILRPELKNEEREEIFKDVVKTGEIIVQVLSSEERAHSYLAASYYSLAKLCPQGGTLQYTNINKAIQIAEKLVGLIRTQPKNINLASLYFERAKIYASELNIHGYQVFFDTVRALDQNPNRKDIHDFLVRHVLSREASNNLDFVPLMQHVLELYRETAPYITLDLAHYYLNQISVGSVLENGADPLEMAQYYVDLFASALEKSTIHESLKSELQGQAYLLKSNIVQIAEALAKNRQILYYYRSTVRNDIQNMYDLIFAAVTQFQNAGKIIEQPRESFSFLFEPEFSEKNVSMQHGFVSPLEIDALKNHIIAYADQPDGDRKRVDPLTQVVEVALDLGGRDLGFNSGVYVLKSPLVVDMAGQSLVCDYGTVIDTQGFDFTIKNAASIEGCIFLGILDHVVQKVPEMSTSSGHDWRLSGNNIIAPTEPLYHGSKGFAGKPGASFRIEANAIYNLDAEKPFYRKQTVIISKGGKGGRGGQGGFGGDGVECYQNDYFGYINLNNLQLDGIQRDAKRDNDRSKQATRGGQGGRGGWGGAGGDIVFITDDKNKLHLSRHTFSIFTLGGLDGERGLGGEGGHMDSCYFVTADEHRDHMVQMIRSMNNARASRARATGETFIPEPELPEVYIPRVGKTFIFEGNQRLGMQGAQGEMGLYGLPGTVRIETK